LYIIRYSDDVGKRGVANLRSKNGGAVGGAVVGAGVIVIGGGVAVGNGTGTGICGSLSTGSTLNVLCDHPLQTPLTSPLTFQTQPILLE